MCFDPIPPPPALRLDTARAEETLLLIRSQLFRPRHWLALCRIAGQHPDPPPGKEWLPVDVEGIATGTLHDLSANIILRSLDAGAWGILPRRLHNVRRALHVLAEDNARHAYFGETIAAHARRLHQSERQVAALRQRLLDLRAGSTAKRASWPWHVMTFTTPDHLMRVLHVRALPAWFGTALLPEDTDAQA